MSRLRNFSFDNFQEGSGVLAVNASNLHLFDLSLSVTEVIEIQVVFMQRERSTSTYPQLSLSSECHCD